MADLHSALQALAPVEFSSVPVDDLGPYLQDIFSNSRLLVDSIPEPAEPAPTPSTGRSRSNTVSSVASNASETSLSSARSAPALPEHAALQKEWGKPIKLSAKDNPLGISVFKLSSKDGRGAWFARRSVHEGLGFAQFRKSLEREFPESLKVQGGPGEGNVRGIGGERKVERKSVEGVGKAEVYHLSAQFPGPTTPRDFVTLLLTSSTGLSASSSSSSEGASSPNEAASTSGSEDAPRHYLVISRPCDHPDCPPRDGYIRGNYESLEFIREVPRSQASKAGQPPKSDKPAFGRTRALSDMGREATLRNARSHPFQGQEDEDESSKSPRPKTPPASPVPTEAQPSEPDGRKRGKTISFMESPERTAKEEQAEPFSDGANSEADTDSQMLPVEWIMITRSDPGGSVPRWMVERGTPAGIVSDAGKFLDWACKADHTESEDGEGSNHEMNEKEPTKDLDSLQTNGHLVGLNGPSPIDEEQETSPTPAQESGMMSNIAGALSAGVSAYAPNAVLDRLPGHKESPSNPHSTAPSSSTSSLGSFATADSGNSSDETPKTERHRNALSAEQTASSGKASSLTTINSGSPTSSKNDKKGKSESPQEKEHARLRSAREKTDERLAKARAADAKRTTEATAKEASAITKAEERHAREMAKHEERFQREMKKLEERREKETRKAEAKQRKEAERDERAKWGKERDELLGKLEAVGKEVDDVKKEREVLKELVGRLQKENTELAMRFGREGAGTGAGGEDVQGTSVEEGKTPEREGGAK